MKFCFHHLTFFKVLKHLNQLYLRINEKSKEGMGDKVSILTAIVRMQVLRCLPYQITP